MRSWNQSGLGLGLSVALACGLFAARAAAQPPEPRDRRAADADAKTVRGTVKEFTTAPKGETDGMILSDGTVIHWPPHLGDRMKAALGLKDRVKVTGRMETTPRGDTHLEAASITNLSTDRNLAVDEDRAPPRRGKRGKKGPRDEEPKTVSGTVREFTTAPRGEVDGMMLSDGTEVHWPPHLGDRVKTFLSRKDRVRVSGWLHTTPRGDTHLRAGTITILRNNSSLNVDDRPERVDRAGRPERPAVDKPGDMEGRLRTLEDKLDRLLRAVERLQRKK